jgi:hypothetical protein
MVPAFVDQHAPSSVGVMPPRVVPSTAAANAQLARDWEATTAESEIAAASFSDYAANEFSGRDVNAKVGAANAARRALAMGVAAGAEAEAGAAGAAAAAAGETAAGVAGARVAAARANYFVDQESGAERATRRRRGVFNSRAPPLQ